MIDPGLRFQGYCVASELNPEELELFLLSIDEFLKREANRLQGSVDQFGIDRSVVFGDSVPPILYSSVIAAVVSSLERELHEFAASLSEACGLQLRVRDLAGAWIDRFRKYCERVALLDLGLSSERWEDLRGAIEIRNCLVHCQGWLPDCRARATVESFLKRHKLTGVDADRLEPDLALTQLILHQVKRFLHDIYAVVLARYARS